MKNTSRNPKTFAVLLVFLTANWFSDPSEPFAADKTDEKDRATSFQNGQESRPALGGIYASRYKNRPVSRFDSQPSHLFKMMDKNRDGKISDGEIEKAAGLFKELDTNKDNVIRWETSTAEPKMKRKSPKEVRYFFSVKDKNGDGRVSIEELPMPEDKFAEMDGDSDGSISLSEFERAMDAAQDRMEEDLRLSHKTTLAVLHALDKNKDGQITSVEFQSLKALLREQDSNQNKCIEKEELVQFAVSTGNALLGSRDDKPSK